MEREHPNEFVLRYGARSAADDFVSRMGRDREMRELIEGRSPASRIAAEQVSYNETVVRQLRESNERLQRKLQELQEKTHVLKRQNEQALRKLSDRQAAASAIAETHSARALVAGMEPLQTLLERGAPSSLLSIDKRLANKISDELKAIYSAMSREIARIADGFADQSATRGAPPECEVKILNNLPICMNYCEGAD